jgi:iron complex transport system substrate-binding protein
MRKKLAILLMLVMLIAVQIGLTACGGDDTATTAATGTTTSTNTKTTTTAPPETATRTIKLLDGSSVVVPEKAERIACLFGPSYEKVFILGCEDKIIADGDFHINGWPWSNVIYKYLNEVPGVPNAHSDLNVEELVKMNPDLVFYFDKPEMVEQMEKLGLYVVPARSSSATQGVFSDVKDLLNVYAQAIGDETALARAEAYSAYFDEKLAMITAVTSDIGLKERPDVYFANQNLLWCSGKYSDIPEVIALAGGVCVSRDVVGGGKTEITMEQLLAWDPDFIIVDHAGSSGNASAEDVIAGLSSDPRFADISAVQNNQVKISPTGIFFWDAGQQKILLLMWMAQMFHPEEFADLDITAELKYFYSTFCDYELTDKQAEDILLHIDP